MICNSCFLPRDKQTILEYLNSKPAVNKNKKKWKKIKKKNMTCSSWFLSRDEQTILEFLNSKPAWMIRSLENKNALVRKKDYNHNLKEIKDYKKKSSSYLRCSYLYIHMYISN